MIRGTNTKKRGSRGGRRGNNDNHPGLQRQNTGPRDGPSTPQQGRRGGAGRGQNQGKQAEIIPNGRTDVKRAADTATAAPSEEHVPVNQFNAQEVRNALRMSSGVKPTLYKAVCSNPLHLFMSYSTLYPRNCRGSRSLTTLGM